MRIRATISAVLEYDIDPKAYLSASTKEILDAEKAMLAEDPETFQTIDWEIQVKEVKEDAP